MSKPERPGELQDVTVDAISLVTKAANGERFKVFKSDKGAEPPSTEGEKPEPVAKAYVEAMKDKHGEAAPETVQKDDRGLLDSVRSVFKALVGIDDAEVQKGKVADLYAAREKGRKLNDAIEALSQGLGRSRYGGGDEKPETDPAEIRAALMDFQRIAGDILLGSDEDVQKAAAEIEKAGRKISGPRLGKLKEAYAIVGSIIEETDSDLEGDASEVNKEDITKVVKESLDEALKPISERLGKLEKAEAEATPETAAAPQDAETGGDAHDVGEVVKAALEEALTPFKERLEKVEKARGFSNRVPEETVQKDGDGFWGGLF